MSKPGTMIEAGTPNAPTLRLW